MAQPDKLLDLLRDFRVLIPDISKYLPWYEHFSWRYVNQYFLGAVAHPYIHQAKRYYRLRDGMHIGDKEAERLLQTTQNDLKTELLETAILSNLQVLTEMPPMDYYNLQSSLHKLDKDREIVRAINASRFSMYQARESPFLGETAVSINDIKDIVATNSHDYDTRILSGLFLTGDVQLRYLVERTNLPISYAHILARHVMVSRRRTQVDLTFVDSS